MKKTPKVDVHVVGNGPVRDEWVRRVAKCVLQEEGIRTRGTLSVVIVNDDEICRLNAAYLNHDGPTDVIAFPLDDDDDDVWGEVYVSLDRTKDQALEYGVPFETELARLIVHGILHLSGYNDQDAPSRKLMHERENDYLKIILNDR
jgi:rRNA maturation RNase YbeY